MFYFTDFEVYLQSKMTKLMKQQAEERSDDPESADYYVNDGLYGETKDDIKKRRSLANESKTSVYFTPTDSVDMSQLQLSPIHINYIKENNFDLLANSLNRPPKYIGLNRDLDCRYNCEKLTDDVINESTIMIEINENDENKLSNDFAAALNPIAKHKLKRHCRVNSNDFYYSLENVCEGKPPPNLPKCNFQPMKIFNDLTIDETSETQTSNSSASDNCIASNNNLNQDSATPDKETIEQLNAVGKSFERKIFYPSNSLPNIKRNSSAHTSKDQKGTYVMLAVESNSVADIADCINIEKKPTARRSV